MDEYETFENDAIPKFNHAEKYLEISTKMLEWTEIEVTEIQEAHYIRTQYFNEGKSSMIQRKDSNGYELIILLSQLNDLDTNIIKIHKNPNEKWEAEFNVISTVINGYDTERKIF